MQSKILICILPVRLSKEIYMNESMAKARKALGWFSNQTCFRRKKQNQGQVAPNNSSVSSPPIKPVSLHKLALFPQPKHLFVSLKSSHTVM